nr:hypothetical protein Itr_chr05CG25220 [Ipomoea trifida]
MRYQILLRYPAGQEAGGSFSLFSFINAQPHFFLPNHHCLQLLVLSIFPAIGERDDSM